MQLSIWNAKRNVRVIRVHANAIDEDNAVQLLSELLREIAGCRHVVLDLDEVCTIDALGLSSLTRALTNAVNRRVRLLICGLAPQPRLTFHLLRLGSIFHVHDSVGSALASCGVALPLPRGQLEAS